MAYETVEVKFKDRVAWVALNRPDVGHGAHG
jgi:enoyl-CoA hydratase/carnithine racemase